MIRTEDVLRRWAGWRIMAAGVAIGAAGVLPIWFYIIFGPADGNPIGLGLLAMAAVPVAVGVVAVGLVVQVVQLFGARRD